MTKVFVAGSRHLSRLPSAVRLRIDTIVEKGFQVLVGDANGADKAFQAYLADKAYPHVLVHCMQGHCRNNLGKWPTRQVIAPRGAKGFEYYSLKDQQMADDAEYGLMLWDGKSKGTINNVVNLVRHQKIAVVYISPSAAFETVRSFDDLQVVLGKGDQDSVERLVSDLHLDTIREDAVLPKTSP